MLAYAQPVDPEIHAAAVELTIPNVPHLHRIREAARRLDPEVGEHRVLGCGVADDERLLPGALPALVDLVRIGRAPVVERGELGKTTLL